MVYLYLAILYRSVGVDYTRKGRFCIQVWYYGSGAGHLYPRDAQRKEGKEGAIALHEGVMVRWSKVVDSGIIMGDSLQGKDENAFFLLCLQVLLLSSPAITAPL